MDYQWQWQQTELDNEKKRNERIESFSSLTFITSSNVACSAIMNKNNKHINVIYMIWDAYKMAHFYGIHYFH